MSGKGGWIAECGGISLSSNDRMIMEWLEHTNIKYEYESDTTLNYM